ncbi:hypothetical protein [Actinophytocola sp.]|uniref:hypothetical protein n=1 Tax=Actinophytocola sp. TaxID=1872138 RepID=UPI002ED05047
MSIQEEIRLYLLARVALIVLVTVEEQRALEVLDEVRRRHHRRDQPGRAEAVELLRAGLAHRFGADTALSSGGRIVASAHDIALSGG